MLEYRCRLRTTLVMSFFFQQYLASHAKHVVLLLGCRWTSAAGPFCDSLWRCSWVSNFYWYQLTHCLQFLMLSYCLLYEPLSQSQLQIKISCNAFIINNNNFFCRPPSRRGHPIWTDWMISRCRFFGPYFFLCFLLLHFPSPCVMPDDANAVRPNQLRAFMNAIDCLTNILWLVYAVCQYGCCSLCLG